MAVNPNEDTEFNDALRKYGIIPPKEEAPPSPSPPPSPTLDDVLAEFTPKELEELGEDAHDDETERLVLEYRQQRLEHDRKEQKRARFGRVYPIGREDYTREITEASKIDEEDDDNERGTGVVAFLYKDGIPRSDITFKHIRNLAERYSRTKFVSIVGDKCIANLPDSRIPMIIVYRKGEIRHQIVAWGADRERKQEGETKTRSAFVGPVNNMTNL
ncbi:thioredoxin-like protein [Panaeolus papilionaceus]|nr:thioredoxin-like protein [Panaeolus papilionaceus]